jgi:hypothetical protein
MRWIQSNKNWIIKHLKEFIDDLEEDVMSDEEFFAKIESRLDLWRRTMNMDQKNDAEAVRGGYSTIDASISSEGEPDVQ